MLSTLYYSFKFRGFLNSDLLETLEVLQSKQLHFIEGAVMQAYSEFVILRELKRRGVKEI